MAVDLQKLKRKMRGVLSTRQVTRALQMVSAMKMRKAQERSAQSRVYRRFLNDLMGTFKGSGITLRGNLLESPKGAKYDLVVVFGSDRGLCGPYNSNLYAVINHLAREVGVDSLHLICIGWKVGSTLARRGYQVLRYQKRPHESDRVAFLQETGRELFEAWETGHYRSITLVYSSLRGMTVMKPQQVSWLPVQPEESEEVSHEKQLAVVDYIDEADSFHVLEQATRRYLSNEILSALLNSEASEHVARMVAMDNATRNAEELYANLKLTYNKARQAKITQEICEIVTGANAIAKG